MDSQTNIEMDELSKRKVERTRRTWPDDGLPAHHEKPWRGSLHPYIVLTDALTRR
jgi:hypothetical protein